MPNWNTVDRFDRSVLKTMLCGDIELSLHQVSEEHSIHSHVKPINVVDCQSLK
jgi:hypothetical protein